MSFAKRAVVTFSVTLANVIGALIYFRVGLPMVELARQPRFQGPLTPALGPAEAVPPVVMLLLQLGVMLWLIYGGTQSERAQQRVVTQRRRR